MAEGLFTSHYSQLPPNVAGDYDDDEVYGLQNGITFQDVAMKGWSFQDFCAYSKELVIFPTPDTAIVSFSESPSHHPYTIDMTFRSSDSEKKKTLHISGINEEVTGPVLTGLLEFFVRSKKDDAETIEVTFKCFATNPRKPMGTLTLDKTISNILDNNECKVALSFQFVSLTQAQCKQIIESNGISCVEFRQCNVEGFAECLKQQSSSSSSDACPDHLKISCTQVDFASVAEGLRGNASICQLDLLLHFMFADGDIDKLTSAMKENLGLERLCLEYLEMGDDDWSALCTSLQNHPKLKVIEFAFTDKFADGVRRLDPERRRDRSNAILQLVQTNKNLQQVNWPVFQQDEEIMQSIERCLQENNKQ
jgi:hypothetical protein